jgi:hypothetical protein
MFSAYRHRGARKRLVPRRAGSVEENIQIVTQEIHARFESVFAKRVRFRAQLPVVLGRVPSMTTRVLGVRAG